MRDTKRLAILSLRLGLGVTFLSIGYMIWKDPELWGSFMQPWVKPLLIQSVEATMKETAVLDMIVGIAMILGVGTWLAALLGALHLVVVIVSVGFNDITARDLGLMAACLSLCFLTLPAWVKAKWRWS